MATIPPKKPVSQTEPNFGGAHRDASAHTQSSTHAQAAANEAGSAVRHGADALSQSVNAVSHGIQAASSQTQSAVSQAQSAVKNTQSALGNTTQSAINSGHAAMKSAVHIASSAAGRAVSAAQNSRESAESLVRHGANTMKDIFASGTGEARKANEKLHALRRERTENLSRSVDKIARSINNMVTLGRDNAEALVEMSHIASDIAQSINSELVNFANNNFSTRVEMYQEAFACRNLQEMVELQNKWLSTRIENFFNQSQRLTEMFFQLATEATEPLNERVAETTERLSKSLAA
jgi:phasin family protein